MTLPDGGRYQDFACATIYWSRDTGAHAVQDAILRRYRELGGPTGTLGYPLTVQIPTKNASKIQEVVLLRRGSVTHSFNSDQRYVELMIVDRRPGAVTAVVPNDGALLPRVRISSSWSIARECRQLAGASCYVGVILHAARWVSSAARFRGGQS